MLDEAAIRAIVRDAVREVLAEVAARPAGRGSPLMTIPEVAELLRVSPKAVRHRIDRGQLLGVVRVGSRILVRRANLIRSLTEGRGPSPRSR